MSSAVIERPIATDSVRDWAPPKCDVPARGRPLSAQVEAAALHHRLLISELSSAGSEEIVSLGRLALGSDSLDRAVRLIAGAVAIRSSLSASSVKVAEAIQWFFGSEDASVPGPISDFVAADGDETLSGLLPYVLDPFGLTTRRSILTGDGCAVERKARKELGTFYTPGDVARSLADQAIDGDTQNVIDPACGAGVFLRAAFTALTKTSHPSDAVTRLFGVDVDPRAVDACCLTLTHDWIARVPLGSEERPLDRFNAICEQVTCGDSLELFAPACDVQLFAVEPNAEVRSMPSSFDAVLTNPPFARGSVARSRVADSYESTRGVRAGGSVNLAWPFWELSASLVTASGRVGIVLPMSVAYARGVTAQSIRSEIFSSGQWQLRFFDRTPDALFGDDVKQRIAIALRSPGEAGQVRTHSLQRWSANRRHEVLSLDSNAGVSVDADHEVVMKIGTELERSAVAQLLASGRTLGEATATSKLVSASEISISADSVVVAPTAYNWLSVFRDGANAKEARKHAAGKLSELTFGSRETADAAYALVSSRIFLWWWRAVGDLFHVPISVLLSAPFPLHLFENSARSNLAEAGHRAWRAATREPVRAINRGVVTTAYPIASSSPLLDEIDRCVGRCLGLSEEFVLFVGEDAERLKTAGRES